MQAGNAAEPRRVTPARSLWAAPARVIALVLTVEVLTTLSTLAALLLTRFTVEGVSRFAALIALGLFFEEVARKQAKMRIRLANESNQDMTSVWTFAGAIVLSPFLAVVLIVALRTHKWYRVHRTEGVEPFRKVFGSCSQVLSCLIAGIAYRHLLTSFSSLPYGAANALAILIVLVIYNVVNHATIVVLVLVRTPVRGMALLGGLEDNVLEFSTLCLGALTAVAVLNEPWLTPVVMLPMALLQRSAMVRGFEVVASTDSKTGLLNAVAWEQLAQRELSRASRELVSTAVMIIDLDRFKKVNDVYGHLAGDVVLREIGRCLTAEVRDYDTVGRFGGEEFVALLPEVSAVEAGIIAERVRARINTLQMSVLVPSDDISGDSILSASIGVACYPGDGTELQELLHAADSALYTAKNGGRNRVEFAKAGTGRTISATVNS